MYKKDQQKGIIALILFGSIGLTYALFDKSTAKVVAVISIVIWLISMFMLNKKNKED